MICPHCGSDKFFVSCVAESVEIPFNDEDTQKIVVHVLSSPKEVRLEYLCCAKCHFPLYDSYKGWRFYKALLLSELNKLSMEKIREIISKLSK